MISNSKRKIYVDSREQATDRSRIIKQIESLGYPTKVMQQDFGDYRIFGNDYFVVDRKKSINELASNIVLDHKRLKEEILRAEEEGASIMFLIEDDRFEKLEDIAYWQNEYSKSNRPIKGTQIIKSIQTMKEEYPIDFMFCKKKETGQRIVELLEGALISGRGCKRS